MDIKWRAQDLELVVERRPFAFLTEFSPQNQNYELQINYSYQKETLLQKKGGGGGKRMKLRHSLTHEHEIWESIKALNGFQLAIVE